MTKQAINAKGETVEIGNKIPTERVTVKTVKKEDVNAIFDYLSTKPYGEVSAFMLTLSNLHEAYKNNTQIIVNLQPDLQGRVEIDDI